MSPCLFRGLRPWSLQSRSLSSFGCRCSPPVNSQSTREIGFRQYSTMDIKWEATHLLTEQSPVVKHDVRRARIPIAIVSTLACLLVVLDLATRWCAVSSYSSHDWNAWGTTLDHVSTKTAHTREPAVVRYNLSLAQAWRNPGWSRN